MDCLGKGVPIVLTCGNRQVVNIHVDGINAPCLGKTGVSPVKGLSLIFEWSKANIFRNNVFAWYKKFEKAANSRLLKEGTSRRLLDMQGKGSCCNRCRVGLCQSMLERLWYRGAFYGSTSLAKPPRGGGSSSSSSSSSDSSTNTTNSTTTTSNTLGVLVLGR